MENAQPLQLTTPVSLIILPASSALHNLQPLTVITTTALNTLAQPVTTATLSYHHNNKNVSDTPSTALTTSTATNPITTNFITTTLPNSIVAHTNPGSVTKTYSSTPPLKPAKKFRSEQEEILRCKRRLDFIGLQRPAPTTVLRRNERERNRVKLINNTFVRLREHLPGTTIKTSKGKAKKLSKVDTLQQAIDYIHALQDLIDGHDAVSAVFDHGLTAPALERRVSSSSSSSSSSTASSVGDACDQLMSPGSAGEAEMLSDHGGDDAPLSPEEAELLDFTKIWWTQSGSEGSHLL